MCDRCSLGRLARDANPARAVLDFDLGQLRGVEQFGELAHQGHVDLHCTGVFGCIVHGGASCQNRATASSASRYESAPKPAILPFAA